MEPGEVSPAGREYREGCFVKGSKKMLTIAIDGPAGAGKSTVAKKVAEALGYTYVNTGAMYRAVALRCLELGVDVSDPEAVARAVRNMDVRLEPSGGELKVLVDGVDVTEAIQEPRVGHAVSLVAQVPEVREALVELQRRMGERGGVVMDGRDIGTVVFPSAEVKIFLTASEEERAARRHRELVARGERVAYEEVLESLRRRDALDRSRAVSPLVKAEDAVKVDSTGRPVESVVAEILAICRERGGA